MDTHTQKFKVRLGLFVAGGIALFVIAIFIIGKQKNLFNPVFKLTTTFYNVSGLQVGNNVRFSGINVGTVDNIKIINDTTVMVEMLIRKEIKQFINSDCKVIIGSEGLIGDRLLIIKQGSPDTPLAKGEKHLSSTEPVETDAIIASLQVTAGRAEIIAKQIEDVMLRINSGHGSLGRFIYDTIIAENLNQTIMNLKKSSKGLDKTIGNAEIISLKLADVMLKINSGNGTLGRLIYDTTIAQNMSQTFVNLKKSSKGLDKTIEQVQNDVPGILASLKVTAGNAAIFSQEIEEIAVKVNSGNGTINMLIQDSSFAEKINQTMVDINSSVKGFDEIMQAVKQSFLFDNYFEKLEKEKMKQNKKKK